MSPGDRFFTIGELAERSGTAPSGLRFYESLGLIRSERTEGNQRRFAPVELRRVSVIRAAQSVGISLEEVGTALDTLPDRRTPTRDDWSAMSTAWRGVLEERIARLERLRDALSGCIGCGCLSLDSCALFNPGDNAARKGAGARYLLGDRPPPGRNRSCRVALEHE